MRLPIHHPNPNPGRLLLLRTPRRRRRCSDTCLPASLLGVPPHWATSRPKWFVQTGPLRLQAVFSITVVSGAERASWALVKGAGSTRGASGSVVSTTMLSSMRNSHPLHLRARASPPTGPRPRAHAILRRRISSCPTLRASFGRLPSPPAGSPPQLPPSAPIGVPQGEFLLFGEIPMKIYPFSINRRQFLPHFLFFECVTATEWFQLVLRIVGIRLVHHNSNWVIYVWFVTTLTAHSLFYVDSDAAKCGWSTVSAVAAMVLVPLLLLIILQFA